MLAVSEHVQPTLSLATTQEVSVLLKSRSTHRMECAEHEQRDPLTAFARITRVEAVPQRRRAPRWVEALHVSCGPGSPVRLPPGEQVFEHVAWLPPRGSRRGRPWALDEAEPG